MYFTLFSINNDDKNHDHRFYGYAQQILAMDTVYNLLINPINSKSKSINFQEQMDERKDPRWKWSTILFKRVLFSLIANEKNIYIMIIDFYVDS